MTIVNLEDIVTKDEVEKIAEKFSAALANDKTAVLVGGGQIIATFMGPEALRDAVHQRVLSRLISNPDELNRLQKRFESDDLVK